MTKTKFQEFMAQHQLSQYALHKRSGISKSQISEWQRGIHRPSLRSAHRLAITLGLSIQTVKSQLELRECYQNDISPTGEFIARQKKNRPVSAQSNDPTRTREVCCLYCRRLLDKAA